MRAIEQLKALLPYSGIAAFKFDSNGPIVKMLTVLPQLWLYVVALYFTYGLGLAQAGEPADDGRTPKLANDAERASNQSLLWGPYRSNLYFGVRPRIPKSLLTGLLWAKIDGLETAQGSMSFYIIKTP